ncbi:MAG TPA: inositol monophosphatase [Candidatus Nanoarchaeia archaeon]|nr:inositol monophosphatase [Candidatus Nanoarchaeia archaeon]
MQGTFKQTAIRAAKAAGGILLKYYGRKITKRLKDGDSYVSQADIESIKKIRQIILSKFPTHNMLDEELAQIKNNSEYTWIIDPLDGTHNFLIENPLFGVSIALQHKDEIILGVVYLPCLDRMYIAEKGKGAFRNGKRINVNKNDRLDKSMFTFDARFRHDTDKKLRIMGKLAHKAWRYRVFGVAVYDTLLVAEGRTEMHIDFDVNVWDYAAVYLILLESGGIVTDLLGNPWKPGTKDFMASNGRVHAEALNVIK